MSNTQQEASQISSSLENVLLQFSEAVKSQQILNERLERRNSQMIRIGLFSIILLISAAVFLMWSLKEDINKINTHMDKVSKNVTTMSNSIISMQSSMSSVKNGINEVVGHAGNISYALVEPDNSVLVMQHIANTVKLMQQDVRGLNKNFDKTNYNLDAINQQMRKLNKKLGVMGHDVNRMSSPVKMFPF